MRERGVIQSTENLSNVQENVINQLNDYATMTSEASYGSIQEEGFKMLI